MPCASLLCCLRQRAKEKKEHGDTPFPGRETQSPCTPFASRGFDGYVRQYCVGSYIRQRRKSMGTPHSPAGGRSPPAPPSQAEVSMAMFANIVLDLTFDQIIAIIGLIVNSLQALVLPITIYLLVVQTRAMRMQTTALVEQSKEMTAQTRVFIDTIYSATYQSLYDAEAHIG